MNLHFKDIELFEKLKKATLHTVLVGSHMYCTNDVNSDKDYLYIYVPSISERNTFYPSHHQLQYKEDGIDHIFINIFSFLKNCLNGDSSINIEAIFHESMKDSSISFLWDMKEAFYNYKILRSYLGICNRDLKEISKQSTEKNKSKKLAHVYRGLEFCKSILNMSFNPIVNKEIKEKIIDIKNIKEWNIRNVLILELKEEVETLRKKLNILHDNKELHFPLFMSIENQKKLDLNLNNLINSKLFLEKSSWYMDLSMFYYVNENPEINYG